MRLLIWRRAFSSVSACVSAGCTARQTVCRYPVRRLARTSMSLPTCLFAIDAMAQPRAGQPDNALSKGRADSIGNSGNQEGMRELLP
jgi:hypothetical protein